MHTGPTTHVRRLGILLLLVFGIFLVIRSFAIPSSWNYNVWYRGDAREDIAGLPLIHGGNESCNACHEDISLVASVSDDDRGAFVDEFDDEPIVSQPATSPVEIFEHQSLNCEACHGPLANHASADEKIADATVMRDSNWQCLNCHRLLITRASDFPQFSDNIEKHRDLGDESRCIRCHDPHNPIAQKAEVEEFDFGDDL